MILYVIWKLYVIKFCNNLLMSRWCHTLEKNSSNQTIRTKTIRFGCQQFVLSSNDAYPHFLDHYCRAKYGGGKLPKNLCVHSVLDSVTKISKWSDKKVYFDNWFSSMSLLQVLKAESLHATGTIGADRLGNDLKISKKDI